MSSLGHFVKVSAKKVKPKNKIKKKTKLVGVLIRLKKESLKVDGSFVKFKDNNVVLVKKRWSPKGKELRGPICWTIRRRKFRNSFSGII